MGDLSRAQRELRYAEMSADSSRWDDVEGRLASIEQALDGLSDAEKAPIAAKVAALRSKAEEAINAEKVRRLVSAVDRQIRGGDPEHNAPDRVESYARKAEEMLAGEDSKLIPAADLAELRRRIAAMRGASTDGVKQRAIEAVTPRLVELEERLARNPFTGLSDMDARSQWQELNALVVGARNNWKDIPEGDADGQALGARIEAMAKALVDAAAACERDGAVASITQSWRETQDAFAGWEAEDRVPSWDGFIGGSREGLGELMPRTIQALRDAWSWQHDSLMLREVKQQFQDDAEVRATIAAVEKTIADAAGKLWHAFDRLMADAERAPTPTDRRDLEKPARVLHSVDSWFGRCERLEPARQRAQALHDTWERAVDELDRKGRELYQELQARANAAWPGMLRSVRIEPGFTPAEAARFRGKTILLQGVRNRSGWDFDSQYSLAVWVDGVPVAGDYEAHIGEALGDTARRTRTYVDTHTDWDVLCVVEGVGRIQERVTREVRIGDASERVKIEEKVPRDCVSVRVVGLRAGAVAVGPVPAPADVGVAGA